MKKMEFIGREHELELLESEYSNGASLILLTGRRRVGKTRLIKEFIKGKDALYFFCHRVDISTIKEELSEAVSSSIGMRSVKFDTIQDSLSAFSSHDPGMKVIVLDEFQYMINADESIMTYLQDLWDNELSEKDVMMILCGSHISTMEKLDKDHRSPLYGRFSRHITLNPLPFETVRNEEFRDSLERYAVLGGIPRYMELFGDGELFESIRNNILDPSSMMFDDVEIIMNDEMREPSKYMAVMRSIAFGNHRITDISSNLQIPVTSLTYYLDRLEEIMMVRKDVPITDDPRKSKNGLYFIADNFTGFWFRFVSPYSSDLSMDISEGAMANLKDHFSDQHAAFVFESVCRAMVRTMQGDIGFVPTRVGRYWNRSDIELDVVAINPMEKKMFVGECKYHSSSPMDNHDLSKLKKKCSEVKEFEDYEIRYGLFSVTGFTDQLYASDAVLIDCGKVVRNPFTR